MTKEEALKVANEMRQWFKTDREKEALETLIPELKESEDERIRKEIIGYFNSKVATAEETELLYFKRWIAYLENLKPSFKQTHDSDTGDSGLRTGIELGKKKEQELVSFNEPYNPDDYEAVMQGNATSIRRKQQEEQKPDWSEEDEKMIKTIISVLERSSQVITYEQRGGSISGSVGCSDKYKEEIAWLKSLRPQYHGDVTMTEAYKMGLEAGKASSWKPSEEQMDALEAATVRYQSTGLESLYEELKKL